MVLRCPWTPHGVLMVQPQKVLHGVLMGCRCGKCAIGGWTDTEVYANARQLRLSVLITCSFSLEVILYMCTYIHRHMLTSCIRTYVRV